MNRIKAKVTEYNGTRYRSRLEARWAVFFDRIGVKHSYEPEYEEGVYPDWPTHRVDFEVVNFPLWQGRAYFDIKPMCDLNDDIDPLLGMLQNLSRYLDFPVFVVCGSPSDYKYAIAFDGDMLDHRTPGGAMVVNLFKAFRARSHEAADFAEKFRFW